MILKAVFEHKNREANGIADSLAKEGSEMEGMWIMWMQEGNKPKQKALVWIC